MVGDRRWGIRSFECRQKYRAWLRDNKRWVCREGATWAHVGRFLCKFPTWEKRKNGLNAPPPKRTAACSYRCALKDFSWRRWFARSLFNKTVMRGRDAYLRGTLIVLYAPEGTSSESLPALNNVEAVSAVAASACNTVLNATVFPTPKADCLKFDAASQVDFESAHKERLTQLSCQDKQPQSITFDCADQDKLRVLSSQR